jgi:hypothetical protein
MGSRPSLSPSKAKGGSNPTRTLKKYPKPLESLTEPLRGISSFLLAIDPAPDESAWLLYNVDKQLPIEWAKEPNDLILRTLTTYPAQCCAIECVQSFGMPVGQTVFDTVLWCGRFIERWYGDRGKEPIRIYRKAIKLHLCGSTQAKDANVRQVLIDRYGPGKDKAVGLKASPGPLYGVTKDCWSALAIAITAVEVELSG